MLWCANIKRYELKCSHSWNHYHRHSTGSHIHTKKLLYSALDSCSVQFSREWYIFDWYLNGNWLKLSRRMNERVKKVHIIKMNGWHIAVLRSACMMMIRNFFRGIFEYKNLFILLIVTAERKLWTNQRDWFYDIKFLSLKIEAPALKFI